MISFGNELGPERRVFVPIENGRYFPDRNNNLSMGKHAWLGLNLVSESGGRADLVRIEMMGHKSNAGSTNTPDFTFNAKAIDDLIEALQWIKAGKLGRAAIERGAKTE